MPWSSLSLVLVLRVECKTESFWTNVAKQIERKIEIFFSKSVYDLEECLRSCEEFKKSVSVRVWVYGIVK